MQDGRTVYYNGNTLKRGISKQSIQKRIDQQEAITQQSIRIPVIDKVFATNQCIWCNRQLAGYQITCNYCHNCQYCGMVAFSNNFCQNCGNHTDDELKQEHQPREVVNY